MRALTVFLLAASGIFAQSNIPNITGNWTVTATSSLFHQSYTGTFQLSQSGTSVSGQVNFANNPCAQSGSFAGTISSDGAFNFTFNVNGAIVNFTGSISVSGNSASGTYQAPPGGCTQNDSGTWTATRQAVTSHFPIDITSVANDGWSSFSGGNTVPTGSQTYNGAPFAIPVGAKNAWAGLNGTAPSSVTVQPWVIGAASVHTLINTIQGSPGVPALASITFNGTNGATYTKNLVGGADIRDFTGPSNFTDIINNSTTINAWTGTAFNGGQFHRLDEQTFTLPSTFAGQTLTAVTINDTGSDNVQRVLLAALTVDGTDAPASFTISGGNKQTGPAGSALPTKLSVLVNGTSNPIPAVTVNFTVTSGSATLSSASAVTDATGTASVGVTLGQGGGPIVITAAIAGSALPAVQFNLTATGGNCPSGLPSITSIKSATDYGGFANFSPGSWLEIKGTNLTVDTTPRQWATGDFQGANAPTSLDGSKVSINGHAGFISYISSGQINAQAPADTTTGSVQVTVTTCAGTSSPAAIQETALAPGVLAPASFDVNGKQYAAATFTDFTTFVGNAGLVAGAPFRPAKPGDTIVLYGVGFGPVTPVIAPGIVVSQANTLPNLSISFGSTSAPVVAAGLAGNFVGLYEFYVTVPSVTDADYPINISVNGTPVPQTVYLTVHQ